MIGELISVPILILASPDVLAVDLELGDAFAHQNLIHRGHTIHHHPRKQRLLVPQVCLSHVYHPHARFPKAPREQLPHLLLRHRKPPRKRQKHRLILLRHVVRRLASPRQVVVGGVVRFLVLSRRWQWNSEVSEERVREPGNHEGPVWGWARAEVGSGVGAQDSVQDIREDSNTNVIEDAFDASNCGESFEVEEMEGDVLLE